MFNNDDFSEYSTLINRYQVGSMIDNYQKGNKEKADRFAIDAITVRGMIEAISFYEQFGADSGLDASEVTDMKYVVNEFDSAQYEDLSTYIFNSGGSLGGGQIATGTIPEPHTYTFTATSDGQTIWTMPFDMSQVYDVDSILLTLNGIADPSYNTDFTIVGNVFTWAGLTVSTGWVFEIKYWI